jgi:hypothetical protein
MCEIKIKEILPHSISMILPHIIKSIVMLFANLNKFFFQRTGGKPKIEQRQQDKPAR